MEKKSHRLVEFAELIGARLQGGRDEIITGIAPLDTASSSEISFLHNPRYRKYLSSTKAAAVILSQQDSEFYAGNALIVADPYLGLAKAATLFSTQPKQPIGIHSSVVIGENCQIDPSASVGPYCVLGKGVTVQENAVLEANCVIGDGVSIGENSYLWPHVTVYYGVKIGKHVLIHSGAVIGSDGFGLARENNQWRKIPQIGSVIIHDNVEVGANTTIDRGALGDTIIEEGVKLDNQVQIGHNAQIGAHTAIAGCVAVAGSAKIGRHCMIGGGACIAGHIVIVDKVVIAGMGMITKSITEPGFYASGTGFQHQKEWQKSAVRFRQLDQLAKRLKTLEEKYTSCE